MRVTLINLFYTPDISPTAHLCASLAEHRAKLGDDVTVLTSRAGYLSAVADDEAIDGVRVRRLWSSTFGSRSNLGRLLDWATFYLPAFYAALTMPPQDVVICLTTPPFIALAGWLHKLRNPSAKFVLWNMDVYPEALERTRLIKPGGLIAQIMRSVSRAIFRRLDHLVSLDEAMNELLLSQYQRADIPVRSTIIPNWERLALFPARDGSIAWDDPLARSLENQFVVLYLGNAGFGHEFQTMLLAADILRDEPVTFLFVGGGALRPWIAAQCEQRRLSNVRLHGYVPKSQTPAVMRRADCALITLDNNMLGVMSPSKLHANLATGLPVLYVGPAGSNVDAAILEYGCGASIRPGDATGLFQAIRAMMVDRPAHQRMRESARKAFEERYCDARALAAFDEALADL